MKYEIDQSGKIEQTNKDTVIAITSSKTQFTLLIDSSTKKSIYQDFNKKDKKKLTIKLFAVLIYILLKKSYNDLKHEIIIDDEYQGHWRSIKNMLTQFLGKDVNFRLDNIGKKSSAHIIALHTFRGDLKPNFLVSKKDIYRLIKRDSKE